MSTPSEVQSHLGPEMEARGQEKKTRRHVGGPCCYALEIQHDFGKAHEHPQFVDVFPLGS